jgi:hypothetical protein
MIRIIGRLIDPRVADKAVNAQVFDFLGIAAQRNRIRKSANLMRGATESNRGCQPPSGLRCLGDAPSCSRR